MPNRTALDPEQRALYGEILHTPVGFELDQAIATTYTLDFETALVIPATLAFHAAENRQQTLDTPLALLEGLERLSSKISIFCEAGRIKGVPKGANRLTALLEETITEVVAAHGGSFHPKLWLLRFTPVRGDDQPRLRLALLSRNLTTDTSWDLSLCLDGVAGQMPVAANAPLVKLIQALPGLASGRPAPGRAMEATQSLADDLDCAIWERPEHIRKITFSVNGLSVNGMSNDVWQPRVGNKLGVVTPFLTDKALLQLVRHVAPENAFLLGRGEEMASLKPETLARFGTKLVLDEMAETEDGEETEAVGTSPVPARGLHAKAFITERHSSTEITLGSGNATSSSLVNGRNVEVFATVSGATRNLGTVEDQLSPDRLGRYLREFVPFSPQDTSAEEKEADKRLDEFRRKLAEAGPTLHCEEEDERVALHFSTKYAVTLPQGIELRVWSVVPGCNHGVDLKRIDVQKQLLARLALKDVTRWIGVGLRDQSTGRKQEFTLGTELIDLPEGRASEILRSVIENREAFLLYIRLLLSDVSGAARALFAAGSDGSFSGMFGNAQDTPILEDMVRALSGDGRQLRDIERLVTRLGDAESGEGQVVPDEFLALWQTFRQVLKEEGLP